MIDKKLKNIHTKFSPPDRIGRTRKYAAGNKALRGKKSKNDGVRGNKAEDKYESFGPLKTPRKLEAAWK